MSAANSGLITWQPDASGPATPSALRSMTIGPATRRRRPHSRHPPQPRTDPALDLILLIAGIRLWRHWPKEVRPITFVTAEQLWVGRFTRTLTTIALEWVSRLVR